MTSITRTTDQHAGGGDDMGPITDQTTISTSLAIQIAVWIVAGLLTYGVVNARVSVLETKQQSADERLRRIEDKLDRVLDAAARMAR